MKVITDIVLSVVVVAFVVFMVFISTKSNAQVTDLAPNCFPTTVPTASSKTITSKPARKFLFIRNNDGANPIYCAPEPQTASATVGFPILKTEAFRLNFTLGEPSNSGFNCFATGGTVAINVCEGFNAR